MLIDFESLNWLFAACITAENDHNDYVCLLFTVVQKISTG